MAINLRERVPAYKMNKAGNYENIIYYRCPEDVCSPALIRKSLLSCKRVKTGNLRITNKEMSRGGLILNTNWATSAKVIDLGAADDCRQIVQFPVYDHSIIGGCNSACCIIFRATPSQLGILLSGTDEVHQRWQNPPFASDEEFPLVSSKIYDTRLLSHGEFMYRVLGWPTGDIERLNL